MSESENKLTPEEAEKLADRSMQTRFNWAVAFLAFIAGLVGLLQIVARYEPNWSWWAFSTVLSIAYSFLTVGLSYSIYALLHVSFIERYLREKYEKEVVKSFVNKYWSRVYTPLIISFRGSEPIFRKRLAVFLSVCAGIVSILLLFLKFLV
jgi:hypothetical protein